MVRIFTKPAKTLLEYEYELVGLKAQLATRMKFQSGDPIECALIADKIARIELYLEKNKQ